MALLTSITASEFRGLSAAGTSVVWASGRNGVFARTLDGGTNWSADSVPGASELFFIDVHAVDASTAYLLGTHFEGALARIYKTTDSGITWKMQYSDSGPGVFFDGMAFWDADNGVAFSDPVEGSFLIVTTQNGGDTWERVPPESIPPPLPGEAGFAASGTAIAVQGTSSVWFGTGGGHVGRVFRSTDRGRTWTVAETPITGGQTAGIFGVTFWDEMNGIAVGGDHTKPNDRSDNTARTTDGGLTWALTGSSEPPGVRWGVSYSSREGGMIVVATGPSGLGFSPDSGQTWLPIDTLGFNTVAVSAFANFAWVAGVDGRIAKLELGSGRANARP
ncbi:MAG: hypothetical protein AMS21_06570 [Gemmatimonas sp. SG8_38_2]|nr:MAG: hypothetical protein AMS21_06570 [Gemmatimonas sp. SG8_38_2]